MIFLPGLVSVSFRELSPEEIIEYTVKARLKVIEWGGDIHVPHGDTDRATKVQAETVKAGLQVAAYGSYYRAGESENEGLSFHAVLRSALALGAPVIRIWAGKLGSENAGPDYRNQVREDAARIADLAAAEGISIAFEYHGNTLTDTAKSCADLLESIRRNNVSTYWQPNRALGLQGNLAALRAVLPWLSNVHVHYFGDGQTGPELRPLREGKANWQQYLLAIREKKQTQRLMIEFVHGNRPEQFLEDAEVLIELLAEPT